MIPKIASYGLAAADHELSAVRDRKTMTFDGGKEDVASLPENGIVVQFDGYGVNCFEPRLAVSPKEDGLTSLDVDLQERSAVVLRLSLQGGYVSAGNRAAFGALLDLSCPLAAISIDCIHERKPRRVRPYSGLDRRGAVSIRRHVALKQIEVSRIGLDRDDGRAGKRAQEICRRVADVRAEIDDRFNVLEVFEGLVLIFDEDLREYVDIAGGGPHQERMRRRAGMDGFQCLW